MPHVLIILTSQGLIPATRQQTGWHLSELAHPYSILEPKVTLTMASPQGGEAPLDPASASASAKPESDTTDMTALARHWEAWTHTYKIREIVARAGAGEFDAVFYVGGRGAMFDLVGDAASLALIQNVAAAGKPIAAVGHGPAALLNATAPSGVPLLAGARVTGFSREEEDAAGMAAAMPFQLETELERVSGGGYVKADRSGTEKVVVSTTAGLHSPLITGQNPASATGVAREILRILGCD
jgi:putative intracellular protease/amidase